MHMHMYPGTCTCTYVLHGQVVVLDASGVQIQSPEFGQDEGGEYYHLVVPRGGCVLCLPHRMSAGDSERGHSEWMMSWAVSIDMNVDLFAPPSPSGEVPAPDGFPILSRMTIDALPAGVQDEWVTDVYTGRRSNTDADAHAHAIHMHPDVHGRVHAYACAHACACVHTQSGLCILNAGAPGAARHNRLLHALPRRHVEARDTPATPWLCR